jgi:Ca2+-binding RTX toxin-like protein
MGIRRSIQAGCASALAALVLFPAGAGAAAQSFLSPSAPGTLFVTGDGGSDLVQISCDGSTPPGQFPVGQLVTLYINHNRIDGPAHCKDINRFQIAMGAGNDTVALEEIYPNEFGYFFGSVVDMGPGDDTVLPLDLEQFDPSGIQTFFPRDEITAGPGADLVYSSLGPDLLDGGPGRDFLKGGGGADVVNGGPSDDRLEGGTEADRVTGGPGADEIEGGGGPDRIKGGPGKDRTAQGKLRKVPDED